MIELRDFVDEISELNASLKISDEKWDTIKMIKEVLHEPYTLTMSLQRREYTLPDFFGDWIRVKRVLTQMQHTLASTIVHHMTEREKNLLNHKLMISAIYFDPRYNFLLTEEQRRRAVLHICELHCRLNQMNPLEANSFINSENDRDEFAEYLNSQASRSTGNNTGIVARIQQFSNRPAINYKNSILEYWEKIKSEEPELHKLAIVLFAIPVSQTSVERAFSSLSYIFNNYRTRLNPDVLSKVLITRLNHDLAPKPNENLFQGFTYVEVEEEVDVDVFDDDIEIDSD